jgi:hypothetical protein
VSVGAADPDCPGHTVPAGLVDGAATVGAAADGVAVTVVAFSIVVVPHLLDDQRTRNHTRYRARHSRSADSARPCEIPHTPPPQGRTGIRCRGTPPRIAVRVHRDSSGREQQPGDSSAEFCLIFDPVRGIPPRRLNTCPGFLPGLGEWQAAVCFSSFCPRSGRRAARRPGLRRAGVVRAGRRPLSMRLPPVGVNGHHPYRLFTRVITAGFFVPATMWDRPGSGGCRWLR